MPPTETIQDGQTTGCIPSSIGTPPIGFEEFVRLPRIDAPIPRYESDDSYADAIVDAKLFKETEYQEIPEAAMMSTDIQAAIVQLDNISAGNRTEPLPPTPDLTLENPDITYNCMPGTFGGPEPDFAVFPSALSVSQKQYLLACFIAGKTSQWTRKTFFAKHKILLRNDGLYQFKKKNAELIEAGIQIRHERVRREGLSLMEERVIALEEHANNVLDEMKNDIRAGKAPSTRLMREYRDTLNDIAIELGQRRKGMDVSSDVIVSVIKVPAKTADRATWEIQAQEVVQQSLQAPPERPSGE